MGRKLDALLGKRRFNSSKLRPLLNLSLSRLAVLKNQRHFRCLQARSDVLQLLQLGNHERALLRVEQVVKEQNLLDVYVMIESYFNLLIERVDLLEKQRECPDELKEAISGLLFASSRCGDFPELLQIKTVFTTNFGKEFVARAVELRNNCGVNPTMIQMLSTRQQNLEVRMKILKEIASENNISLQLDENSRSGTGQKAEEEKDGLKPPSEITATEEGSSGPMKARRKYKDVADAAQAAFESAAYAAEAARAAVELSRSESQDPDEVITVKVKQTENSGELKSFKSDSEDGMKTSNTSMIGQRGSDSDDSDDDSGNQQESIPSPNQVPARFQSDMKPKAALGRNPFATSVRTRGVRGY